MRNKPRPDCARLTGEVVPRPARPHPAHPTRALVRGMPRMTPRGGARRRSSGSAPSSPQSARPSRSRSASPTPSQATTRPTPTIPAASHRRHSHAPPPLPPIRPAFALQPDKRAPPCSDHCDQGSDGLGHHDHLEPDGTHPSPHPRPLLLGCKSLVRLDSRAPQPFHGNPRCSTRSLTSLPQITAAASGA